MKITTGFSDLFWKEFKEKHNEIVKEKYLLGDNFGKKVKDFSFEEQLLQKLEATLQDPDFSYEISHNETKTGAPRNLRFSGKEYFTWAELGENGLLIS